jgi:integrase
MKLNLILKNTNNPTKIYCRFKPTQIHDFTCATPLITHREDWNPKQQQIKLKSANKNKDFVNKTLKQLDILVVEKWVADTISQNNIPKSWLKDVVANFFGQTKQDDLYKIYFLDYIQKFVDASPERIYKGKIISPLTVRQYQATLNKLKAFEKHKNIQLKFEVIDLVFYNDFLFYCKTVEKLGNNSIGGHIKNIKMWCKNCELDGFNISPQYKHKSFATISSETNDPYFTEVEINSIFNYDFSKNLRLSNARDWLIIGLRTGFRVSDLLILTKDKIQNNRIRITTIKTNADVVMPLHWQIKANLQRNNNELPYKISDQNFNDYIKEVAHKVGINEVISGSKMDPETGRKKSGRYPKYELVTSHIGRRTFVTLLQGKINNQTLMALTTHKSEAQLSHYNKTQLDTYADHLEDLWQNENQKITTK